MSGLPHPMVRRSDKNPRAEVVGDNGPSSGQNTPPKSVDLHTLKLESTSVSSTTATETSESQDEQLDQVSVSSQLVMGSPGAGLGLDAVAASLPSPVTPEPGSDRYTCL